MEIINITVEFRDFPRNSRDTPKRSIILSYTCSSPAAESANPGRSERRGENEQITSADRKFST